MGFDKITKNIFDACYAAYRESSIKQKLENISKGIMKYLAKKDESESPNILLVIKNASDNLNEHNAYKQIPKTSYLYRIDIGQNIPGKERHIHVYDQKFNQLYAMNIDGTSHDGSKWVLSKKEKKFYSSIGFAYPENGILEWYEADDKEVLIEAIMTILSEV